MRTIRKTACTIGHLLATVLLLVCSVAHAQLINQVEVVPGSSNAEIIVQFSQKILYLKHTPLKDGKQLRIFIRFVDTNLSDNDLIQETVSAPRTDRVPDVTVLYPELINGILVTFSETTSYTVRPGTDGYSIVITLPLLPAAPKPPAKIQLEKNIPEPAPPAATSESAPATALPPPSNTAEMAIQAKQAAEGVSPTTNEKPVPAVAQPATPSSNEIETRAAAYLDEAKRAMAAKDPSTAVNRLNRILGLPTSSHTEAAQALIGAARELNGEILKARAEYELYLKLFPAGPNAPDIRKRLAALPKEATAARRASPKALPKEAGPAEWTYNGNVSSFYYTGKSQIETLTPPPPGQLTFNREILTMVDQDSLITSINLNARRRDAFTDTRFVIRDTDNKNYLNPSRGYNRVYSAYVDHTDKNLGYYLRAGRQNPNGIGVMDRFDGVQAGYNINQQWRVNAVYGDAVEFNSPFKKNFYGASVDLLPQVGFPGITAYAIQQTIDDLPNRRAVGTEARYFDGHATAYGMLDYDVLYKGINIALLQGNYLSEGGDNYFFVIDHRRAPAYSLTNALPAAPGLSLQDMVAIQGIEQVRAQAIALTAMSDMMSVGVTHPLSDKWQVGVDYRMSSISSTEAAKAVLPLAVIGSCLGTIDPVNNTCVIDTASQQASGKSHVVTFQTVGTNLFIANAVGVANISLIMAPTYSGQSMSIGYALPLWEKLRIDANIRYYTQKDDSGSVQNRTSPSLKITYQWRNGLYLEGEFGHEESRSTGPGRDDLTKRNYIYIGLRWDFN